MKFKTRYMNYRSFHSTKCIWKCCLQNVSHFVLAHFYGLYCWPVSNSTSVVLCKEWLSPNGALTHWGRVTHICVSKLTTIGSDNGLSPGRRQAIIWTNAGLLLIRHLGTNFSEILIGIQTFSFKKMHMKMSSAKWRPFCLGPNVLTLYV